MWFFQRQSARAATDRLLILQRASLLDRQYFERVAKLNRALPGDPHLSRWLNVDSARIG